MARPATLASPLLASLLVFGGLALTAPSASAAPPLPALPGAQTPPPAGGPAAAGPGDVNGFTADQVRRGIVQIEQGGRALGVGTVLLKDGRVLTALSALANVDQPELRYSDGTVVKAKIGHKDKAWDLAPGTSRFSSRSRGNGSTGSSPPTPIRKGSTSVRSFPRAASSRPRPSR
jgi:S1-C subfamily serine protease